jgi:hypothetical protein
MTEDLKCGKCGRYLGLHVSWATVRMTRRKGLCHRICPSRPKKRGEKKRRRLATMSRKDWNIEATTARNFSDPRSRVMQDGREILFEDDYRLRVAEVLERDNYECQWSVIGAAIPTDDGKIKTYGMICGAPANQHPHHIKHRWPKRDDRAQNLMSICDPHNISAHPEKQTRFGEARERSAP